MKKVNAQISFIAVASLFFLWALAHNLNPILIPHLKKACTLSDMQSALVDSSFYIAYFLMAMPAGWLIQKWGYQKTIVGGLFLFSLGCLLFIPAANTLSYPFFLSALFVIASGLTFLETAANPYVTVLGEPATATRRLNFAQSFNGLGATLAAFFGGKFILSSQPSETGILEKMNQEELQQFMLQYASTVKVPYLIIATIVFVAMLVFLWLPLPDIRNREAIAGFNLKRLWSHKQLKGALLAQFVYVGAQVGIGSFFIRYAHYSSGLNNQEAAFYLSIALLLFMCGRFMGSWLMQYINSNKLLSAYAIINIVLLDMVIWGNGMTGVYALMATQFFMSIMFPSIFANGIKGLGDDARYASSLIVMTIAGGAFFPPLMGAISDKSSIPYAFLIPLLSFVTIAVYAQIQRKLFAHEN